MPTKKSFRTRIIKKPTKVKFTTKSGRKVSFKAVRITRKRSYSKRR